MTFHRIFSGIFLLALVSPALADIDDTYRGDSEAELRSFMQGIDREFPEEADRKLAGEGFLAMVLERYPPARTATGLEALALLPQAIEAAPTTFVGVSYRDLHERGLRKSLEAGEKEALEAAKAAHMDKVATCLAEAVPISGVTFKIRKSSWDDDMLLRLDYSITNTLDRAISKATVLFEIRTPGRAVPWRVARLGNDIPGGIEPGETRAVDFTLGGDENDFLAGETRDYVVTLTTGDVEDAAGGTFLKDYRSDGFGAEFCAQRDVMGFIGQSK